jgi:hypothetical protein
MKNDVFWDVMPCGSNKNRRFGGCYDGMTSILLVLDIHIHEECSLLGCDEWFTLLITANVVPSSPILPTLMTEAISSSETSVLTRAIPRNILEDCILHCHRRESLTYMSLAVVPSVTSALKTGSDDIALVWLHADWTNLSGT